MRRQAHSSINQHSAFCIGLFVQARSPSVTPPEHGAGPVFRARDEHLAASIISFLAKLNYRHDELWVIQTVVMMASSQELVDPTGMPSLSA